jgi:hypothetical protein
MANGEYLGAGSGITKGLWHLNGSSADSSGNGNNGSDTNITYVAGRFGQCALFNGSTSKIDLSTQTGDWQTISVSFWVKTTQTSRGEVFTFGSSTNKDLLFATPGRTTAGKIDLCIWNGSTTSAITQTTAINDGNWHHIVLLRNGTSGTIYLDGASDGSGTLHNTNIGNNRWGFGYNRPGGESPNFDGSLDEVIIENVVWSAEKVKKYYTYAKGRFNQ